MDRLCQHEASEGNLYCKISIILILWNFTLIILFLSVFFSLGQTTSDVVSMWSVGVLDAAISLGIGKMANSS